MTCMCPLLYVICSIYEPGPSQPQPPEQQEENPPAEEAEVTEIT